MEEFALRGNELYNRKIRPLVEEREAGRVVAIDIESGEFEVAENTIEASNRLLARRPDAQTWFIRIGHRGVHRFGPRTITRTA